MSRLIFALAVSIISMSQVVHSQTPPAPDGNATTKPVNTQQEVKPDKTSEACACESQVLPEDFAIVNGIKVTRRDVEKRTGDSVRQLQQQVIDARARELDLLINSRLLADEAKRLGIGTTKLLEQEVVAKVKLPTVAEAQAFYDQNKSRIPDEFQVVRDDILKYLLDQRQRIEAKKFADGLRTASDTKVHDAAVAPPRNPTERARVLATVHGEKITAAEVEDSLQPFVFEVQEQVYKLRKEELDLTINDMLLSQEAQKRKMTTSALLDAEVKPNSVTEEQARAFFEQNKDRVSGDFAQTKDSIIRYLEQIEARSAERVFVEKLRAAATIQVFLVAPESPVFSISISDQPSLGDAKAPVTIVAFTDYQCPSCAAIHPELERLVKEYGDRVKLVTRDFPLSQHAESFKAAEAAEAAREQGRYWEYVHVLMRNQSELSMDKLKAYASELSLDRARFDGALESGKFADAVKRDIEDGMRLRIMATPTIFINGRRVTARSYEDLKANVDAVLKTLAPTASAQ